MEPWFTLDIHVMTNEHLSKQGIRWPVSRDYIAGSSLQLIKVMSLFMDSGKLDWKRISRG